jgi:hypothetical protein
MQELDGLATLAEKQEKKKSGKQAEETSELPIPATITAAELVGKEFPEPRCIVPDLLPDVGLALLGGAPKIGKSWLMLHLCIGAAMGGHALGTRQMPQCESLYLALEDTPRRLQQRLTMMLGRDTAPAGCHLATEWPKLPGGGLCLRGWLDDHPNTKLVVVDTLQRFRATQDTRKGLYGSDYDDIAQLKAIADQYQLALVVVHHLRKAASDDPLEQLSGTTGLTGAADTIWILKRGRIQASAELLVTGRDVEEQEIALEFNAQVGTWTDIGDAEYHRTTIERQRVVNVLRQASKPMQPKEITEELGMKSSTVRSTLSRMAKDGEVQRTKGGYVLPTITTTTVADTAAPAAPATPAAPAAPAAPTKETISVAGVAPTDEDCNASKGHSSRGLSESAAGVAPVAPDAVDVASSAARSVAPSVAPAAPAEAEASEVFEL